MKKIVFYSERWLDGGIESLIINIISKSDMSKLKYKIIVGQKETSTFDEIINKYGIEFIEMHKKHYKNAVIRMINSIFKFKKVIKNEENSIIHINIYNSIGLIMGKFVKNKSNVIIHAHNNGIDKQNDKLFFKRISNVICKKMFTDSKYNYIACSNLAANFCFNTKKIKNYYIMKNGIDSNKFMFDLDERKKMRKELGIEENVILIGHVGRFSYQKNHEFLIDVFEKFLKEYKNTKLLLIGTGPLKENIEKKVKALEISNDVIFLGNTDKVNKYMSAMDIFLFPSFYEGLGIAIIEAQCTGLKCIANEKLSQMVKVTNNIEFLKLDIDIWKNYLLEAIRYQREDKSKEIKKLGFDILESVQQLEKEYEVIYNEKK